MQESQRITGPLTDDERRERKAIQDAVGCKVKKRTFREYSAILASRGLSIAEALEDSFEREYLLLWFSLNQDNSINKAKREAAN